MRDFVNTADDMQIAMANIRMKNDFTGIGRKAAAKQEAARKSVELSGDTQTIADVEAAKAKQQAGEAAARVRDGEGRTSEDCWAL